MNSIEVANLSKTYSGRLGRGGIRALDSVSLEIRQGEVFALLGPNGAGKTTLVKILLGIVHASSGSASLNNLPVENPDSRQRVGFLPENHRFPGHLTALQLMHLTAQLQVLRATNLTEQSMELLTVVGMDKWADTKIRKYSKGMMQRLGLAQAMLGDPDVLILDEPTDGVDPVGRAEIRTIIQKLRSAGRTVLLNSHLLSEVESVADRAAILHRGKLLRVDSMKALTSRQMQYQIEADMGEEIIDIPQDIGRRVAVSREHLVVELTDPEHINEVIDMLRRRNISIRSIQPLKISLEQSFLETIAQKNAEQVL